MKIILLLLVLYLLANIHSIRAQGIISKFIADSLRYNTASCDTYKFSWQGTNQGLYMINNQNGKRNFLTVKTSKLPDNYVTCIACCDNGQTYIGTRKGILFWDNFAFFLYNTENTDLPENDISSLKLDHKQDLWVKTRNCGLMKAIGHCVKLFRMHKVDD